MRPTVVLWDIDGTLITAGGAGRRAIERAFLDVCGESGTLDFSFGGMTDRAIIRGGLEGTTHGDAAHIIDAVLDAYVERLEEEVAAAAGYRVFDGVSEALQVVAAMPNVTIGLGTGNVERGARIKLERAQLNDHFRFGGFGCDDEDRAALIRAGATRGARQLGRPLQDCRLLIIGDTPRDTAAAHANAGQCLAVATGSYDRTALEASGARWVLDELRGADFQALVGADW